MDEINGMGWMGYGGIAPRGWGEREFQSFVIPLLKDM